jgi:hypothetical protein
MVIGRVVGGTLAHMAKSKKTSARASKVSKAKSVTSRRSSPASTSKKASAAALSEAERLLASWPAITDIQRAAFASQHEDARCDQLGARTQSAVVVKDALALAHSIDVALRTKHAAEALRRYSPARFAFFLERIVALDRARDEQVAGKDHSGSAKRTLDHARIRATSVRRELHHALELLVGDEGLDRLELDRAIGDAKTDDALVSSLNDLARLADSWLRRPDSESRALVASIDLQRGDVDLAWATAAELESAAERANGKRVSYAGGQDTPSVDRAEGRVLLEMRHAMRAFEHAAEINKAVPRLVPGAGTRAVLANAAPAARATRATEAHAPN